jgi:hypothetical protein
MGFRYLAMAEFSRLTQTDKIEYVELAMKELERKRIVAGQHSLFAVRPRGGSRGKG